MNGQDEKYKGVGKNKRNKRYLILLGLEKDKQVGYHAEMTLLAMESMN